MQEVKAKTGLEVIKLQFNLQLKTKCVIGCFWTLVRNQPIIALYFEFETVLQFYNLEAWTACFTLFIAYAIGSNIVCALSCAFNSHTWEMMDKQKFQFYAALNLSTLQI